MNLAVKYLPNYTVEDYLRRRLGADRGSPYAMAPSSVWKHQRLISLLVRIIAEVSHLRLNVHSQLI